MFPRPTLTSPPVSEIGAKGPMRRERESQKRIDLKGSDWKKKSARAKRMEERVMVMKRSSLVGLWR